MTKDNFPFYELSVRIQISKEDADILKPSIAYDREQMRLDLNKSLYKETTIL